MQTTPYPHHSLAESKYLNLPEARFLHWCRNQYGLNKGVLNTIDNWFYDSGIINIASRRIHVLAFLEFAKAFGMKSDKHKFMESQEKICS
ncbi:hypothetical protein LWS67_17280 [Bacillus atrophaeus]|uniref:hypothetical protein n=1 Tax=Bacillus atrophaeus TaxID=1452 RepID=UPI001EFB8A0E|nr:hypothetical protein [Bacillus atrophaeus]MCG8398255.1 hypothetical protein [Bacillus atrophaeus]